MTKTLSDYKTAWPKVHTALGDERTFISLNGKEVRLRFVSDEKDPGKVRIVNEEIFRALPAGVQSNIARFVQSQGHMLVVVARA
jgi:hypothetical protein